MPRYAGSLLAACGHSYSSDFIAGRVGGSLPCLLLAEFAMSGDETPVLEVPLAISDHDLGTIPTAAWMDVTYKNAANGAPTVLLVHATPPQLKIDAYRLCLDRVATDPTQGVGTLDEGYAIPLEHLRECANRRLEMTKAQCPMTNQ